MIAVPNLPHNVPSTMHVLFVFGPAGGLAAFWYHPNRAALEERLESVKDLEGYTAELVRYVVVAGEA